MRRCWLLGCLACGLLGGLLWPGPAAALDLLGWLRGDHHSYTAMYLGGAEPGMGAAPGAPLDPQSPDFGPSPGYVPAVPSFHWGYFGAPYHPVRFCHKGYYGDGSWWRYRLR
jgi:hypothetical protein